MRAIVCGGRDYADLDTIGRVMRLLFAHDLENTTIVHGDAKGADRLAGDAATWLGCKVESFPADWARHGKAAGPIRNRRMLAAGADLVVAFPGGRGTAHMVGIAREAGLLVLEVAP